MRTVPCRLIILWVRNSTEHAVPPVVEIDLYGSDSRVLGVRVDELPDGRHMLYVPSSPMVTIGQVHILPASRVTEMDLCMTDTIGCLSQMGLEARKLYTRINEKA